MELDVDLGTYGRYYLSKLENVSVGGVFVRTRELHPIGSEVILRFSLPDGGPAIETSGMVVWVYDQAGTREPNSSGMGIEFKGMGEGERERIERFVRGDSRD